LVCVQLSAYNTSMPRTPRAAPIPAPNAARGYDAAFVVATAGAERVALALAPVPADRVGTRTPERLVELRPMGAALIVPTDDMADVMADVMAAIDFEGVGVGVGVAETTTG
jgi:hypothetical protein